MTLEEAIKHCEEIAELKYDEGNEARLQEQDKYANECIDCAAEHRQLAEWLKELKKYREENYWIPCSERFPDCEQEVLICTERKLLGQNAYIDQIVAPAIYEDGTMPECDSKWSWIDMDFDEWDEENDCGIVLEGWWENRHFNRDEEYNNPVDLKVVAWMPLPEPWEGEHG